MNVFSKKDGKEVHLLSILYNKPWAFLFIKERYSKEVREYCHRMLSKLEWAAQNNGRCDVCGKKGTRSLVYHKHFYEYNDEKKKTWIIDGAYCSDSSCYTSGFSVHFELDSIRQFTVKKVQKVVVRLLLEKAGFDCSKRFSAKRLAKFLGSIEVPDYYKSNPREVKQEEETKEEAKIGKNYTASELTLPDLFS